MTSKIMKKYIFAITALTFLWVGCKPEIKGDLGDVTNKEIGMSGTWELQHFYIQDPNSPILEQRDFTNYYVVDGVEPMRVNLDAATHTYDVSINVGKNFLGDSGTWHLDDVMAPSFLYLENLNDTITIALGSMVNVNSEEMNLNIEKKCSSGFKNVIYKFNFNRVQ
jgi:hypothetical protein